ncbi:MAG: MMPL family transporter [Alphaproteobacteria bacterium]|nr:MMPL family transporter [Alphaproteobacteria bacterium]
MAEWFAWWGRAVVEHRVRALALSVLLSLLAAAAIGMRLRDGLPVDFTPQALFMDKGDDISRLQEIEAVFGREDNDVVLMVEGDLGTVEAIAFLRDLHADLEALDVVEGVDSLVDAATVRAEGELLVVEAPLDDADPAAAIARAASDPALAGLVIGRAGDITAVRVRLDRERERVADLAPAVATVVETARARPTPAGITVQATGVPFIRSEVVDLMIDDETRFLPLVAVLFAGTCLLLFRRFWSGLAPLFVVLVADLWVMGALLASGAVLNVLSVLVPTLVVVIGLSDGVHIVARYRDELADRAGDRADAMAATMRHMAMATFLTSFTTAAGFASLLVAKTQVVRDFGTHCAVAVLISWIAVMLVLPTWLAFVPTARVGGSLQTEAGRSLFEALHRLVARHPAPVLVTCLGMVVGALWLGRDVQSQSSILEMYQPEHPTFRAVHDADTRLGGIVPVFVYIELPPEADEGAVLTPELLRPMAALEAELRQRPEVGWASSPASWVARIHGLLTGAEGIPDSREAVAQELLLAEMSGELPLDALLTDDRRGARILMLTQDAGGRALMETKAIAEARAAELFAGTGARVDVTGDGLIASSGVAQLVDDLVRSVGLVVVVILVTMLVLLRDLRLALIAAVPNLVPLVFTLATLGVLGEDLQITNIVSFTVAVGLAVDDTIHFVVRYREERDHGHDVDDALHRTFHGAGRAIVLTSVLLVVGFGVLAWSDLTSTRWFGILSAVTMIAALLADLLLLPALLHLFDRRNRQAPTRSSSR